MTNKELFRQFSEENKTLLPFSLYFNWWNEVVRDNWDVAVVNKSNQIFAIMPYSIRQKGPWKFISNPHITPYCGPFIAYPPNQKTTTKISFEHEMHQLLIEQLPSFSEYSQNCHLDFTNSLTFIWNGFKSTNRFTYLLSLNPSEHKILENFRENNRRQIKNAKGQLQVRELSDANLLQELINQSIKNKIPIDYFQRTLAYAHKYKCGKMWIAEKGKAIHATLFCIWDETTAYYLLGGSTKEFKRSGAISLLMWEAICHSKTIGKQYFNFEGSSIASIEKYLRGFGGNLTPLQHLEFKQSKSLAFAKKLRQ